MTNDERTILLATAANRLEKASADLTSVDKLPARQALKEAIRIAMAGTEAEELTEALIFQYARDYLPFDLQDFNMLVGFVSVGDEQLSNVFTYYKTMQMMDY